MDSYGSSSAFSKWRSARVDLQRQRKGPPARTRQVRLLNTYSGKGYMIQPTTKATARNDRKTNTPLTELLARFAFGDQGENRRNDPRHFSEKYKIVEGHSR